MPNFDERFAREAARQWLFRMNLVGVPDIGRIERRHLPMLRAAFEDGAKASIRRIDKLGLRTMETPDTATIRAVSRDTVRHLQTRASFDTCNAEAWRAALEELFVQGFSWVSATARGGKIARKV